MTVKIVAPSATDAQKRDIGSKAARRAAAGLIANSAGDGVIAEKPTRPVAHAMP